MGTPTPTTSRGPKAGSGPRSGDDRPTGRPPGQGAAGPGARGAGHRLPHTSRQRQRRAGPRQNLYAPADKDGERGLARRKGTPTATPSKGPHVTPRSWTRPRAPCCQTSKRRGCWTGCKIYEALAAAIITSRRIRPRQICGPFSSECRYCDSCFADKAGRIGPGDTHRPHRCP